MTPPAPHDIKIDWISAGRRGRIHICIYAPLDFFETPPPPSPPTLLYIIHTENLYSQ